MFLKIMFFKNFLRACFLKTMFSKNFFRMFFFQKNSKSDPFWSIWSNLVQFDSNLSSLILLTKKFEAFLTKGWSQPTTKKLLGLREQSSQSKILRIVIFPSFFGRIEDTIICFWDCLTFRMYMLLIKIEFGMSQQD